MSKAAVNLPATQAFMRLSPRCSRSVNCTSNSVAGATRYRPKTARVSGFCESRTRPQARTRQRGGKCCYKGLDRQHPNWRQCPDEREKLTVSLEGQVVETFIDKLIYSVFDTVFETFFDPFLDKLRSQGSANIAPESDGIIGASIPFMNDLIWKTHTTWV